MISSFSLPTYSLDYVIERSVESIIGYLRISKPDKACQVLVDLQSYVKSRPVVESLQLQDHVRFVLARVRKEIIDMKGPEGETASMLLGVLDTLEGMKLVESSEEATACFTRQEDVDMVLDDNGSSEGDGEVECKHCGDIILHRRLSQHIEFWCQRS